MASGHGSTSLQLYLVGIGEVLRNNRLVVPQFQRSYCWKVEQEVLDYWTDLSRAINGGAKEEYFFGTIVITQDGDGTRKRIIDGQQRLVTSSLLIAAIRDELRTLEGNLLKADDSQAVGISRTFLASKAWNDRYAESHLKLNESDNPDFLGITTETALPGKPVRTDSDIVKAYRFFREKISQFRSLHGMDAANVLEKWVSYIQHRAQLAVVETPTEADAYVIFETLNNRGADLTTADLLKNHLFGAAGEQQNLNAVRNNWHQSLGTLQLGAADAKFTKFLRHYWSSKVGKITERDLYAEMRKEVTHRQEALHFSENLLSAAHAYTALSNPESDFWAPKCSGNGHRPALDTLAMFDLVPNKILLLAAVEHFHSHELEKLLRAMVNWSVRGMIMSMMNRGRFEDQYSQIAVAIRKGEVTTTAQVRLRVEDLIPSDTDFREQFALATVGRSDSKLARYYLSALETTRRKESQPEFVPNSNPSQVNLEHVFPQNAKEADWEDFIKKSGDKQDAASWVYRIGNMVLLQTGVNSKIGNKSFAEKVEVFKASGFELTRKVGEKNEWTPDSIRLRQTVLAGLAVKTWPR
ncbi:DUF262 domain-containing protein [Streptomyces sp. NPDC019990]|uniref:DUF262 domain-containing protein n=1 Tax=Streptomyces sp. NPDC019990 TaxID=3154693 RepID=UPI0033F4DABB